MVEKLQNDADLARQCRALAAEVERALGEHAIVNHPKAGRVYAFEVDAFGNYYCTDDGNIPNLLSLPYLGAVKPNDKVYLNTRKLLLSSDNPYWCIGTAVRPSMIDDRPRDQAVPRYAAKRPHLLRLASA